MTVRVTSLCIYPVKGCRGVEVKSATITDTGFAHDRCWLIVGEESGRFESQRSIPRMALIETAIDREALSLSAPGLQPLKIALAQASGPLKKCKVWEWAGDALDEGDVAAEYLSTYFAKPVRLMRYAGIPTKGTPESESTRRQLDLRWAPKDTETAFSDGYPYLLANEASLDDLNTHLEEPVPMDRFRPNITIAGVPAWEEDRWEGFVINGIEFRAVKPCMRCKVTTTDQGTAEVSKKKEPLRTLESLRSAALLGWTNFPKNAVFFGWNLIARGQGEISVGDSLEAFALRTAPLIAAASAS